MANALERTLQRGYRGAFAIDLDDQQERPRGHLSVTRKLGLTWRRHLCGAFRKGDLYLPLGGDEFVVLRGHGARTECRRP